MLHFLTGTFWKYILLHAWSKLFDWLLRDCSTSAHVKCPGKKSSHQDQRSTKDAVSWVLGLLAGAGRR